MSQERKIEGPERYCLRVLACEVAGVVAGLSLGFLLGNTIAEILPQLRFWNGIFVAGTALAGGLAGSSIGVVVGVRRNLQGLALQS